MIVDSMIDLIGNTPMLRLQPKRSAWELYIKLEKFNPGQSMKDRPAINMIRAAELEGRLRPGGIIIESSSGNTAIGLSIIAASKGYRFMAILDRHGAAEKVETIRAYGGEVVFVDSPPGSDDGIALAERERYAAELAERTSNSIYVEQHHNPNNTSAYLETMAKEILADVPSIDVLLGAIGTTGSICGTAKGLRKFGSDCRVVAVEPKGSIFFSAEGGPYFQSGTGNPPGAELPRILDRSVIDEGWQVTDMEAFATCRVLAKKRGLLIGGSAGGVLFKALEFASGRSDSGSAVLLACDGGEKYMDTIYNDEWLRRHDLLNRDLEAQIADVLKNA